MWSDANPLTPGTDCAGNQLPGFVCTTASTDARCSVTVTGGTVQALVVAGGGGGTSGGGGGGGVVYNSALSLIPQTYSVTVGGSGSGGAANGGAGSNNGGNSLFGTVITAVGGGHGGPNDNANAAVAGGSGGGGGATSTVQTNGGAGTVGQGYSGGTVTSTYFGSPYPAAGGGAAGGIGGNPTGVSISGNGGLGISNNISGTSLFYGGGGGGSTWSNGTHGTGGSSVGGNGGYPNGSAGVVNTGGGGGGGAGGGGGSGAAGGSGIVIISYPTGSITATPTFTGGGATTYSSGNTIQTFTGSGSLNVTSINSGVTISTFSVGYPTVVNNKASRIKSVGSTQLLKTSNGAIWREYKQTSVDTPTQYTATTIQVLVVAGGGGGGAFAGGGGAGGLVYEPALPISTKTYNVKVGLGGAGATTPDNGIAGSNGGDSSFSQITAFGGGGGGTRASSGRDGGSGGGASPIDSGILQKGGKALQDYQGNDGGTQIAFGWGGSGGGGAGSPGYGGNGNNGGDGGPGFANPISGSTTGQNVSGTYYLSGGGGGGTYNGGAGSIGAGGAGGGGQGTRNFTNGVDGTPNTGGGGGGSDYGYVGGAGGSGVVIVSYLTGSITASGGVITTSGGNTIHTMTSSGRFVVGAGQRASCQAILNAGESTGSGMYWIYPSGSTGINVYCDMTDDGGGWTLVLQNNAAVTTPAPNWANATGSNTITGTPGSNLTTFDQLVGLSFWNNIGTTLRAEVGATPSSISHKATYTVSLSSPATFYVLNLSNQNILLGSTAPGLYTVHNNSPFTTFDGDHDAVGGSNCAQSYLNHPWWYTACWNGNFFAGGGSFQDAAYWTGTTEYFAYGSLWLK